jgi:hypothetical protein
MGEMRNAYEILVGRPEGKRPLGRPRRRCEDNITTDIKETEWEFVDWMHPCHNRDQKRDLVKTVMSPMIS